MDNYSPKQRVFGMLKYLEHILDSGESLDARRYEINRNIKNCLSWETELHDSGSPFTDPANPNVQSQPEERAPARSALCDT